MIKHISITVMKKIFIGPELHTCFKFLSVRRIVSYMYMRLIPWVICSDIYFIFVLSHKPYSCHFCQEAFFS